MLQLDGFATLANGLREMYLYSKDLNQQPFTKLTLNRDSRGFFADNILGFHPDVQGPTIRSHRRLLEGKEHFAGFLQAQRDVQKDNYPTWLREVYFKITQHLTVIVYEVANDLDAGVIFETMNDRGRPLTELEKVKNYLLYVCSKLDLPTSFPLEEQINATWAHIFEELMAAGLSDSDNEDQFLRAHWLAVYDYDQKKWNQFRSIKDQFALKSFQGRHTQMLRR